MADEKTIDEHNAYTKKFYEFFCENILQPWSTEKRKPFDIDVENIEVIRLLSLYFTRNPAFENYVNPNPKIKLFEGNLSLRKGITLIGNVGSGKTLLMYLINKVLPIEEKFTIVPCDYLTDQVRKNGAASLVNYGNIYKDSSCTKLNNILFDDLGVESKARFYGDIINPMYDIMMRRNRAYCEHNVITHFTTNIALNDMENVYDNRFKSRVQEMSNIIILGANSTSKDRRP